MISSSVPSNFAPIMSPRVWYMATSWAEAWLHSLVRIRDTSRRTGREGQWASPGLPPATMSLVLPFDFGVCGAVSLRSHTPIWIKSFFLFRQSADEFYAVDAYLGVLPVFSFAPYFPLLIFFSAFLKSLAMTLIRSYFYLCFLPSSSRKYKTVKSLKENIGF